MHFITHLFVAILFAYALGLSHPLIFIISAVLIDLDHIYEVLRHKGFKKKMLYNIFSFRGLNYIEPQNKVHLLHTFEVLAMLFMFGNFFPVIKWIFLGFSFHMAMDAVGNLFNRNFGKVGAKDWIKHWFLTYYIFRPKTL